MRFREGQPDGFGSEANNLNQAYEALSRRVAEARAEQRLRTVDNGCQIADLAFHHLVQIYQNLSVPELVEHALMRGEGGLSQAGALCVKTVPHAARSPRNTLIVNLSPWASSAPERPRPLSKPAFRHLYQEMQAYVQGRSLYVTDGTVVNSTTVVTDTTVADATVADATVADAAVADTATTSRIQVRIITELASQALFAQQLLQPLGANETRNNSLKKDQDPSIDSPRAARSRLDSMNYPVQNPPAFRPFLDTERSPRHRASDAPMAGSPLANNPITIVVLPGIKGEPSLEQELPGEAFTALYPEHRLALIGGSRNCCEIQTALTYLLEQPLLDQSVLPLENGAQAVGSETSTSLVLGLTGTDEMHPDEKLGERSLGSPHPLGWFPDRISTLTAGWYGDVSLGKRSAQFGSLLENVILDPKNGAPNFGDRRWSEAPHLASPAPVQNLTGPIKSLVLCLFDPLGIFPALARLTPEQAQYYYLCGYGNWDNPGGSATDPGGSFQACFSAEMTISRAIARVKCLGDRIRQAQPQIFLVNTAATWSETSGLQLLNHQQRHTQLRHVLALGERLATSNFEKLPSDQPPFLSDQVLAQQLGPSPLRRTSAEGLFRKFAVQIEQFTHQLPQAIRDAGPRL